MYSSRSEGSWSSAPDSSSCEYLPLSEPSSEQSRITSIALACAGGAAAARARAIAAAARASRESQARVSTARVSRVPTRRARVRQTRGAWLGVVVAGRPFIVKVARGRRLDLDLAGADLTNPSDGPKARGAEFNGADYRAPPPVSPRAPLTSCGTAPPPPGRCGGRCGACRPGTGAAPRPPPCGRSRLPSRGPRDGSAARR